MANLNLQLPPSGHPPAELSAELSSHDFRAVLACLERFDPRGPLENLPADLTRAVEPLLPATYAACNIVDPVRHYAVGAINHTPMPIPKMLELLTRYMHQHPILMHMVTTQDGRSRTISDFLTLPAFHRLPLYNELFRLLGVNYQIAISLPTGTSETIGVIFSRDTHDFTPRERSMLDLLRPHLMQLVHQRRQLAHLQTQLTDSRGLMDHLADGIISLTPTHTIAFANHAALRMLGTFFTSPRAPGQLPQPILDWLNQHHQTHHRPRRTPLTAIPSTTQPSPLTITRPDRRLTVRLIENVTAASPTLTLNETRLAAPDPAQLLPLGLTDREAEIMHWMIEGKTSPQIARLLGISPRTIHKHTERIFRKLNVETRTAAVARALENITHSPL